MFKNPREKAQIVHLVRQVYHENISSFHKTYLEDCKGPHSYLFLDVTQSINDALRFRTKILTGEACEVLASVLHNKPYKVTTTLSPLKKEAKP